MNTKNIAMWAIIVLLTIGLYNMFKNPQPSNLEGNKVIFSEFLTSVENGEVVKVEIQGKNIKEFIRMEIAFLLTHQRIQTLLKNFQRRV